MAEAHIEDIPQMLEAAAPRLADMQRELLCACYVRRHVPPLQFAPLPPNTCCPRRAFMTYALEFIAYAVDVLASEGDL